MLFLALKGLILLWLVDPAKNLGVYWGVAVLIALGEAGKEPPLKAFLADQLKAAAAAADDQWKDDVSPTGHLKVGETRSAASVDDLKEEENKGAGNEKRLHEHEHEHEHVKECWSVSELLGALVGTFVMEEKKVAAEEKQLDVHVKIWWSLFKILGALTGTFGLGSILGALYGTNRKDYWGPIFVASAIVMGVSLVIFLLGYPFYQPEERPKGERSPIWAILKVFTTAFRNRGFHYSEKSTDYFEYDVGGKIPLSPDIPLSRFIIYIYMYISRMDLFVGIGTGLPLLKHWVDILSNEKPPQGPVLMDKPYEKFYVSLFNSIIYLSNY